MRTRVCLCLALLAAACDRDAGNSRMVSSEQIERVSTPTNGMGDASRPAGLEPLSGAEIAEVGRGGSCIFRRGPDILLIAAGSNAVARIDGEARHFVQSVPIEPTGGFFEDRQLSISIGRVGLEGPAARATITNRRLDASEEVIGTWMCEGMD